MVVLLTTFCSLLVQFAVPQPDNTHTLISLILTMWFLFPVFVIGIPTATNLFRFMKGRYIGLQLIWSVIIPGILISLGGPTNWGLIIIWYSVPSILFITPNYIKMDRIWSSLFYISGAVILWIGFDHRYTKDIFASFTDLGYVMNSFWVIQVGYMSYGLIAGMSVYQNNNDHDLMPSVAAFKAANVYTPLASIVIIPIGLFTGFLVWNPVEFDLVEIVIGFIGIFLTIAIQEEMIFRGILLKQFDRLTGEKYRIGSLLFVSILFALTHWNNEGTEFVRIYFIVAFFAGIAYGLSYRKAGMFAAILSHTLIDWFWALLLERG